MVEYYVNKMTSLLTESYDANEPYMVTYGRWIVHEPRLNSIVRPVAQFLYQWLGQTVIPMAYLDFELILQFLFGSYTVLLILFSSIGLMIVLISKIVELLSSSSNGCDEKKEKKCKSPKCCPNTKDAVDSDVSSSLTADSKKQTKKNSKVAVTRRNKKKVEKETDC